MAQPGITVGRSDPVDIAFASKSLSGSRSTKGHNAKAEWTAPMEKVTGYWKGSVDMSVMFKMGAVGPGLASSTLLYLIVG